MFEISRQGKLVILGIGIPTAVGLLYYLLKTASDDDEEDIAGRKSSSSATSRQTVIEVQVPRKAVGAVIGRQGATIKEIQEQSGAKVNFKDYTQSDDTDRTVVIRGTPEAAQSAECRIRHILANMPVIVQAEMEVPKYALGRIIGRGGESIRQMSRASKTKILIDKTRDSYLDKPQIITIVGAKDQIVVAKGLIQEKLDEEEEFRARTAVSAANRETRHKVKDSNSQSHDRMTHSANNEENNIETDNIERTGDRDHNLYMEFPNGRDYVEVYVSAIATPGHFWVQTIGSMALQLDKLSDTMTRYYEGEGKNLMLSTVEKGDIVAAPFENDKTWYRAKVMDIINQSELDLFYVDYGDSAYMASSLVKPLSSEYLTLPFQAIECRLAGLKPNGEWTEEAFNKFEALTYCAKWKVLQAKAVKFSSGTIPHVQLIDTNGSKDIAINEEMIKCGFAVADT
ncbi:tudor and KH domain-containing protein-like [Mercenaria mercenaria]|uniref:tudor and KH domain-containing protein-like n=1 Tax=Mercenaria mercenaria TaxID=6596 RepID=UPI00234E531F|nr:tudor and KH domain-containing protein-like [Mercenaria mercenaria]